MVVDDRGQIESDVVLCHTHLSGHFDDLDLDIDLDKSFRQRVDVNKTWVDGASELSELGDQTDVSLRHRFVWIGADDAAGDGAAEADT